MREQHPITLVAGHMAVSAWAYADYWPPPPRHQPTQHTQCRASLQARIGTAETAHKKLEAELSQLRPHAADLEQQLSQCQVKLKAAQADVTDLRAEALHSKVRVNIAVLTVPHCLCILAL